MLGDRVSSPVAVASIAVLCSVARGTLVDEQALIRALESETLAAAILDMT